MFRCSTELVICTLQVLAGRVGAAFESELLRRCLSPCFSKRGASCGGCGVSRERCQRPLVYLVVVGPGHSGKLRPVALNLLHRLVVFARPPRSGWRFPQRSAMHSSDDCATWNGWLERRANPPGKGNWGLERLSAATQLKRSGKASCLH